MSITLDSLRVSDAASRLGPERHPVLRARRNSPNSVLANMLTAEEAAGILNCSVCWVQQRAARGDIKGYKMNNRWCFKRAELANHQGDEQ